MPKNPRQRAGGLALERRHGRQAICLPGKSFCYITAVQESRCPPRESDMATATGTEQGKSSFVEEFLKDHQDADAEAVKAAWQSFGREGTIKQ